MRRLRARGAEGAFTVKETVLMRNASDGSAYIFPRLFYMGIVFRIDWLFRRLLYLLVGWPKLRFQNLLDAVVEREQALTVLLALGTLVLGLARSLLLLLGAAAGLMGAGAGAALAIARLIGAL